MKLHIHFQTGDFKVNEEVSGENADAVVAGDSRNASRRKAGFLVGGRHPQYDAAPVRARGDAALQRGIKGRRADAEQLRGVCPDGYRQKLRDADRGIIENHHVRVGEQ